MTGWNMPPGCSRIPGDEPVICAVCFKCDDACICPECPDCGAVGDPACYRKWIKAPRGHNMRLTREQVIARADGAIAIAQEKLADAQMARDEIVALVERAPADHDIFSLIQD